MGKKSDIPTVIPAVYNTAEAYERSGRIVSPAMKQMLQNTDKLRNLALAIRKAEDERKPSILDRIVDALYFGTDY